MKFKLMFGLSFLLCCSLASSCKKGDAGPVGPQGQQGVAGVQGVQGPAGSKILSGTGSPVLTMGNTGDYYLDVSSSLLYGPKGDAGWGAGISLKGATGAAGATGASGSQIYSGNGAPAAATGNNGDYYLDQSTYNLYGPKAGGAWNSPLLLQGPAGPQGATGAQGPAGTANVIYSGWSYATGFNDSIIDNSHLKVAYLAAPSITSSILNNGTVLVYFTYGGGVFVLPYTSYAGSKANTINYIPLLRRILITRFTHDNSNSVALSTLLQYRYIVIPGGVPGGRMAARPNYNDYAAVCRYYGIPQ